jgi:GLPGLI family protein
MKKNFTKLFLILTIAGETFSQQVQFTSKVTVTYDMYIMFNTFPYRIATLDFNNSEASFSHQEMGDSPNSKLKSKAIKGSDKGNYTERVDTTIVRMYKNKESGVLLQYPDNGNRLLIDSIQFVKWKYIEGKTKKTANYDCFMAEGSFRGCYYTVWYTPEIPTSFGPWKLNGCPGLILEVTRDDKALAFYATKIEFEEKSITLNPYDNKKKTTYSQLRQMQIDALNKSNEEVFSQRGRDEDIIIPNAIFCLECDFMNELKHFPNMKIIRNSFED